MKLLLYMAAACCCVPALCSCTERRTAAPAEADGDTIEVVIPDRHKAPAPEYIEAEEDTPAMADTTPDDR